MIYNEYDIKTKNNVFYNIFITTVHKLLLAYKNVMLVHTTYTINLYL